MKNSNIILSKLNGGQLQNLAVELLPRLYPDWGTITHNGIVEGTEQTRKGTPDAYCIRENGSYVLIQVSGEKKSRKIIDDLEKSICKISNMHTNLRALFIAFVSFEPDLDIIDKCIEMCNENNSDFEFYTNSSITSLLEKHMDLYRKYLGSVDALSITDVYEERIIQQSRITLENWEKNSKEFVYTSMFEQSMNRLEQSKFIILLGEGMSGKTSLAYALCIELIKKYDLKPNIIELNKFEDYYNPRDCKKIYCFDDVFGETTIEDLQFNCATRKLFLKINNAIELGAFVILTSRSYIFNEVIDKKKLISNDHFSGIFDKRSIINVEILKQSEKDQILYNFIKHGNLSRQIKTELRPYLNEIAKHPNFKPELARRLGDSVFLENKTISIETLYNFFQYPNDYLRSIFRDLNDECQAAILLVLLNRGHLLDAFGQQEIDERILIYYDVTPAKINKALKYLNFSFVNLKPTPNGFCWTLQHLSIGEALLEIFRDRIELFIALADYDTLIKETSCLETDNFVFIPPSQWAKFISRLFESFNEKARNPRYAYNYIFIKTSEISNYFANRTSDNFLIWFNNEVPDLWEQLTTNNYSNLDSSTYVLVSRLMKLQLINEKLRIKISERIKEIAFSNFDIAFVNEHIKLILGEPDFLLLLNYYSEHGFTMALNRLDDEFYDDPDNLYCTEEAINKHYETWLHEIVELKNQLMEYNLWTLNKEAEFNKITESAEGLIQIQIENSDEYGGYEEFMKELIDEFFDEIKTINDVTIITEKMNKKITIIVDEISCDEDEAKQSFLHMFSDEEKYFLHKKLNPDEIDIFWDVDT
ncbi:hypothetical protein J25TS5_01960 [Paenibacillus faecis]|uniref:nSTAND3 domain-containing NTPase n=1 Tax=Paenibacillus faecis TaxID=862114 RepID=UPI001B2793A1|nr:hypothetical protein [Paenibacillus faecis]GIO83264.1 hypothetical protein J25TS5_01960 [Paenibacillus faecis]